MLSSIELREIEPRIPPWFRPKVGDMFVHKNSGTKCVVEAVRISFRRKVDVYDLLRLDGKRSTGLAKVVLWAEYEELKEQLNEQTTILDETS